MLFREALQNELDKNGERLSRFIEDQRAVLEDLASSLGLLLTSSPEKLEEKKGRLGHLGAFPADELFNDRSIRKPFDVDWSNHAEARDWADIVLRSRTTFAADGSQIYAGKETSIPVAAVQIGWFENPHDADRPYEKNASMELMTPDDLFRDQEEPMNPDIRVEERRLLGEARRVGEFLKSKKGWSERGERMPVAFFDNPLIVPFSQKGLQRSFVGAVLELITLSEDAEVPVVGYVARSFSRDVITLINAFSGNDTAPSVYDAGLFSASVGGEKLLKNWGDRTCFFYSDRVGLDVFVDQDSGRSSVGFTYLSTTSDSTPARLDMPSWVYEKGVLDETVDVVRAECVVGLGYPYALETADQTAVIASRDREVFFRALQDYASRGKLDFSVSRKDQSKSRRR